MEADVQILAIVLVAVTLAVIFTMLVGRGLGRVKALLFFGIYAAWTAFIVGRALDWQ